MTGSKILSYLFFAYPKIVVPIIFVAIFIAFLACCISLGSSEYNYERKRNPNEDKEKSHNDFMRAERQREYDEAYAEKIRLQHEIEQAIIYDRS